MAKKVTVQNLVEWHGLLIDGVINRELFKHDGDGGKGTIPDPAPSYSYEERRLWILNNEFLYNWARSKGVDFE